MKQTQAFKNPITSARQIMPSQMHNVDYYYFCPNFHTDNQVMFSTTPNACQCILSIPLSIGSLFLFFEFLK